MRTIYCTAVATEGRFANRILHYVAARAIGEAFGWNVKVARWIGDVVFELSDEKTNRFCMQSGECAESFYDKAIDLSSSNDIMLPPYYKLPKALQSYLFRHFWLARYLEWTKQCNPDCIPTVDNALHIRRGDFLELPSRPMVDVNTLVAATGCDKHSLRIVREDRPRTSPSAPWPVESILSDFHYLYRSRRVFTYPTSTYGAVAGMMSGAVIMNPVFNKGSWSYCEGVREIDRNPLASLRSLVERSICF